MKKSVLIATGVLATCCISLNSYSAPTRSTNAVQKQNYYQEVYCTGTKDCPIQNCVGTHSQFNHGQSNHGHQRNHQSSHRR